MTQLSGPISCGDILTSVRHRLVDSFLKCHAGLISDLLYSIGSPLHFVFPQIFAENALSFKNAFALSGVNGEILFAKKANKSDCFSLACGKMGLGIDVASAGELVKALAGSVKGAKIGISGPEKSEQLLSLAIRHQCLIAIDSLTELERVSFLSSAMGESTRVLLRILPEQQNRSRFGLTPAELSSAVDLCLEKTAAISLEGLSFHLSGYSTEDRAYLAGDAIDLCQIIQARGLMTCRVVNMGGGFPVQYVDPQGWDAFLRQDRSWNYHNQKTFVGFYPYGARIYGDLVLRRILETLLPGGLSLAEKARRSSVSLMIEPGRALLDQAGLSVFMVQGVKDRRNEDGCHIVTVQGSSLSLSEQWFNSEFLPNPVLLPQKNADDTGFTACVGGNTCLENDMISWRKIRFHRHIQPGDQIVYLNTAGYQMDSNESSFHEAKIPSKISVEFMDEGKNVRWKLGGV